MMRRLFCYSRLSTFVALHLWFTNKKYRIHDGVVSPVVAAKSSMSLELNRLGLSAPAYDYCLDKNELTQIMCLGHVVHWRPYAFSARLALHRNLSVAAKFKKTKPRSGGVLFCSSDLINYQFA
jgi:hypothetical protein